MNKRLLIIVLIAGLVVSAAAFQAVEGKKGIVIPNAALVLASIQPEKKSPLQTPKPEALQPAPAAAPAPQAVQQVSDGAPAPEAVKQKGVSDYGNYAAVDYFNLGISLFNEGMYAQAIDAFRQVLFITPGYGEAHYNLALCHLALGNGNAAFEQYQTLRNIDKALAEGLYKTITASAMSNTDNKFIMQIGAFKNNAYAEAMIEKLKRRYLHAYIDRTGIYNKVRICGIRSREQGDRMMLDIENEFNIKPYLVRVK